MNNKGILKRKSPLEIRYSKKAVNVRDSFTVEKGVK
jgi:hypothetical protein